MAKNHFKGVCLGLSGGIDSALVAAMAADAVGGSNVYGISMPSMYSSDGSKDDAADLAKNIGAHYDIQPIEPLFVSFQKQLDLEGVAAENLQARIRGVIVMAYSNSKGLLAVATGNKSELACGYSTIYGDAVGGYAPIKDLLKTRVWEISRWRNKLPPKAWALGGLHIVGNEQGSAGTPLPDGVMIPVNSIEKAPSAELARGRKTPIRCRNMSCSIRCWQCTLNMRMVVRIFWQTVSMRPTVRHGYGDWSIVPNGSAVNTRLGQR